MDSFFIYNSHCRKKLELSRLYKKKVWSSKQKNYDICQEIIDLAANVFIFKSRFSSKLIDFFLMIRYILGGQQNNDVL